MFLALNGGPGGSKSFLYLAKLVHQKLAVLADRDNRKQRLVHIGVNLYEIEMK